MVSRWPRDPPNDQGPMSTVHLRMPDISERGGSPLMSKDMENHGNTICQNVCISTNLKLYQKHPKT